jgi:hypothetical protein
LLWIAGSSPATTIEWISPRPGRFRARASARVASRNGKRDERYTEPNQPVDPTKDRRINAGFYGVAPSPGRQFGVGLLARLSGLLANDIDHTDIHSSAALLLDVQDRANIGPFADLNHHAVSGGSHPCARAYATNRRASAAGTIFPLRTVLIRPALKPQSSE